MKSPKNPDISKFDLWPLFNFFSVSAKTLCELSYNFSSRYFAYLKPSLDENLMQCLTSLAFPVKYTSKFLSVFPWGPLSYSQQLLWTMSWNGDSSTHCHQRAPYLPLVLLAVSKSYKMFKIHFQNLKH